MDIKKIVKEMLTEANLIDDFIVEENGNYYSNKYKIATLDLEQAKTVNEVVETVKKDIYLVRKIELDRISKELIEKNRKAYSELAENSNYIDLILYTTLEDEKGLAVKTGFNTYKEITKLPHLATIATANIKTTSLLKLIEKAKNNNEICLEFTIDNSKQDKYGFHSFSLQTATENTKVNNMLTFSFDEFYKILTTKESRL